MKIDILAKLSVAQKTEIYEQSGRKIAFCDYCGETFVGNTPGAAQDSGFHHIKKEHLEQLEADVAKARGGR